MADSGALEERLGALEAQIERLNARLGAGRPQISDLTAEEIQAYQKVRDVIAVDYGDFCGINDCFRPRLCHGTTLCLRSCIRVCINECTCGPCGLGPGAAGGLSRFEQFG